MYGQLCNSHSFLPSLPSRQDGFLQGKGQLLPVHVSMAWIVILEEALPSMTKIFPFLLQCLCALTEKKPTFTLKEKFEGFFLISITCPYRKIVCQ